MRLHIHWDRTWRLDGIWRKDECRCGARRLRLVASNWWGPLPPGWPDMHDRHGRDVADSGWVGYSKEQQARGKR